MGIIFLQIMTDFFELLNLVYHTSKRQLVHQRTLKKQSNVYSI